MSQFISLEISAEQVCDLMAEDGNFAIEMWLELAHRIDMGAMKDDASDLVGPLPKHDVQFLVNQFGSLTDTFRSGFNTANFEQI